MKIQQYHRATSLEDAYNVLHAGSNNHILGGALWLKQIAKEIDTAIDLQDLNLHEIEQTETHFIIGSMATLYRLETAQAVNEWCDQLIKNSMQHIMGVAFRNTATIGGSIIGRYAFSDLLGPLLVLNAEVEFYRAGKMTLEAFLNERRMPQDILVAVHIPKERGQSFFKKVSNTRLDFAVLNIAMFKSKKEIRIAFGSRPGVAALAKEAMKIINQTPSWQEQRETLINALLEELKFGNNQRGSEAYRKQLAQTYLIRGIEEVMHNDR